MRFLWNLEGDFLSQLYMSNYPFRAGVSLFSLLHASLCSFAPPPNPTKKKKSVSSPPSNTVHFPADNMELLFRFLSFFLQF